MTTADIDKLKAEIARKEAQRKQILDTDIFHALIKERDAAAEQYRVWREKRDSIKCDSTRAEVGEINRNMAYALTDKRYATAKLAEIKARGAILAADIARDKDELAKLEGTHIEVDSPRLNNLVNKGMFEIGSKQWHEERALGIGGSDAGKLMTCGYIQRADPDLEKLFPINPYAEISNWKDLALEKAGLAEAPEAERSRDARQATVRGDLYEDYIRHMFAAKHPDLRVAECKYSWEDELTPYIHANFDGLIVDANGKPTHVLEIKTGTTVEKDSWGPSGHISNAPIAYQVQTMWYAHVAGLKGGYVAALIDDLDYREYYFTFGDDDYVDARIRIICKAMATFWGEVEQYKAAPPKKRAKRLGFPIAASAREMETLAILCDVETDEVPNMVCPKGYKTKTELAVAVREKLAQVVSTGEIVLTGRKHKLVGLDIETTSLAASSGRIIETGIFCYDDSGQAKVVLSRLHGLSERERIGDGVGEEDVHGISLDMIADKAPLFGDAELAKQIVDMLRHNVLVAHNAAFEDSWLCTWLPGYAKARDAGEIQILDTMYLSKWFITEEVSATHCNLETFCIFNGVPYVGAHAAGRDAQMMMEALVRLASNFADGRFVPSFPSESEMVEPEVRRSII